MKASPYTTYFVLGLLILGLANMLGTLIQSPTLKGLAAGTAASPAPKVFSSVDGLETFSTKFTLQWTTPQKNTRSLELTHDIYPRLQGPYNRRNIWGAMLAYGPALTSNPLTQDMFIDTMVYGLCGDAPLLQELGIDPSNVQDIAIVYTPREGTTTTLPMTILRECP